MKDNEFHQEISKALAGCQQVEKELKDYIGIAFKAAQRQNLPYQPLTNDIEAMPLGKLIKAFKNNGGESDIVSALEKFTEERNFLAHRASSENIDLDGNIYLSETLRERLAEIQTTAEFLRRRIYDSAVLLEFNKISGAG